MATNSNQFYCSTCQLGLNSKAQQDQHFTGRAHSNKLREVTVSAWSGGSPSNVIDQTKAQFQKQFVPEGGEPTSDNSVRCDVCHLVFNSNIQADQHYRGQKHINTKKLASEINCDSEVGAEAMEIKPASKRKISVTSCDVCCLTFTSEEQAEQHLSGSKHAKKLRMSGVDGGGPIDVYLCELCRLTFNSKLILEQHLAGKKHAKKKIEESLSTSLNADLQDGKCDVCNVIFTSHVAGMMHFQGKKHAKCVSLNKTEQISYEKEGSTFFCGFCSIHLNSLEQLKQHHESSQHLQVLEGARKEQSNNRLKKKTELGIGSELTQMEEMRDLTPVVDSCTPVHV